MREPLQGETAGALSLSPARYSVLYGTFGALTDAALAGAKTELQRVTYLWLYRFYVARILVATTPNLYLLRCFCSRAVPGTAGKPVP